jgi:ParB-like chromosome segregation protein Spo0J
MAGDAGCTIDELSATYHHHSSGDLHRICLHEHQPSDRAAEIWLIKRAVTELGKQVEHGKDGRLRLTVAVDELRDWRRRRIALEIDPNKLFHDPFNPLTEGGVFARNIRAPQGRDDTTELEQSMQAFGWLDELPAIADERGVVLSGHRRLEVAKKLGIEPRIQTRHYGEGDQGTVRRAVLAFAANVGVKPLTAADRRFIAKRLYEDEGLTQAEIAQRLHVTQETISRDLAKVMHMHNPERGGRPRKPPDSAILRGKAKMAASMADEGEAPETIGKQFGVGPKRAQEYVERGRAERQIELGSGSPEGAICPTCHGTGRVPS